MTLSEFKTAIDATIGGLIGLVTKARHKSANDVIADALYPNEKQEINGSGSNTILDSTPGVSGLTFSIFIKRMANEVIWTGYFTNGSGGTIGSTTTLFNLIDTSYRVKASTSGSVNGNKTSGAVLGVYLTAASNAIKASNPIANGETVYLNGRYTCED